MTVYLWGAFSPNFKLAPKFLTAKLYVGFCAFGLKTPIYAQKMFFLRSEYETPQRQTLTCIRWHVFCVISYWPILRDVLYAYWLSYLYGVALTAVQICSVREIFCLWKFGIYCIDGCLIITSFEPSSAKICQRVWPVGE